SDISIRNLSASKCLTDGTTAPTIMNSSISKFPTANSSTQSWEACDEHEEPGAGLGHDGPGADGLGKHVPGHHRTPAPGPAAAGGDGARAARWTASCGRRPDAATRAVVVAHRRVGHAEHRRVLLPAVRGRLSPARRGGGADGVDSAD